MSEVIFDTTPNHANESEGLGDAGTETYLDAPLVGLAREIGQNSRDAHDTESSKPAKITFDLFEVKKDEIPAFKQFETTVNSCYITACEKKDKKAIPFFENLKSQIERQTIRVLRIADFNTKGLRGPCEEGTPFHSLVKSKGISNKDDNEDSGGSHGIGKNAVFAVSEGRSVLYSTVYAEKGKQVFLFQGKSQLISHKGNDGEQKGAASYWGKSGFQAIEDVESIPKWLQRTETGTSIFALFFPKHSNWEHKVAISLINNFTSAIYHNDLEFSIGNGEIEINAATLPQHINSPEFKKAAKETGTEDELKSTKNIYECLSSELTTSDEFTIKNLGPFRLKLLLGETQPKQVNIMRNGMLITASLCNFKDKLTRFDRTYSNFIAIVEPSSAESNAKIKGLENPKHDQLSAERIPDVNEKKNITKAMNSLGEKIRQLIKEKAYVPPMDKELIDELSNFFADGNNETTFDFDNNRLEDHPAINEIIPASVKKKRSHATSDKPTQKHYGEIEENDDTGEIDYGSGGGIGGSSGGIGGSSGGIGGSGSGIGGSSGGIGDDGGKNLPRKKKHVAASDFRIIPSSVPGEYRLWMTAEGTGTVNLKLTATGIQKEELLYVTESKKIKNSNEVTTKAGSLEIDAKKGERICISLTLKQKYTGPINVKSLLKGEMA
ncbi:hypothetical protein [Photobacterium phosphoreum]|uniref:hypothetical protein n=1 Tax=Photobacterium phosphoreum TaxID=659 RepID=UPI0011B1E5DC|nr:hypothetical protein [Photobacterium phosphoreum]